MTPYFVDSTTGDNADNGTTFDLAFATWEYAMESGGLASDAKIFVRPTHFETPTSDIAPVYDGSADAPLYSIGWPRAAIPDTIITQADFTNGSKIIDNVVGITPARVAHSNRYITAPDGEQYHITAVLWEADVDGMGAGDEFAVGEILTNETQTKEGKVWAFTDNADTTGTLQYVRDSATAWVDNDNITSSGGGDAEIDASGETAVGFLLSSEYAGSTVTGTDGKFQIEEDPDYDEAQAIDDSTWTIKKTDWDAQDLPLIDFNDGAFNVYVYFSDYFFGFKNIEFKDGSDSTGLIYFNGGRSHLLEGCLFKQTAANARLLGFNSCFGSMKRVILEGSGSGASQSGIYVTSASIKTTDCAIFNVGDYGLHLLKSTSTMDKMNVGIEMANGDDEIYLDYNANIKGNDLALGGTNGTLNVSTTNYSKETIVSVINDEKILGAWKKRFMGGTMERVAVSGETPNKKVSDYITKVSPNTSGHEYIEEWAVEVFRHTFEADNTLKTYKYWLYNDMGVTLNVAAKDDVYLKCDYVSAYDDTSEYVWKTAYSTQTGIADAADADDWDYLEVTCQPAVASKVIITCFVSTYEAATADFFIDTAVVIS